MILKTFIDNIYFRKTQFNISEVLVYLYVYISFHLILHTYTKPEKEWLNLIRQLYINSIYILINCYMNIVYVNNLEYI